MKITVNLACLIVTMCVGSSIGQTAETAATTETAEPDIDQSLAPFFSQHCNDCHLDGADEGGLELDELGSDLSDAATFSRWERIFDRVNQGEMPPSDSAPPSTAHRKAFERILSSALWQAHVKEKGTVLRRLNRREYQNSMNDIFGTSLDLEGMLPEDGRFHEFDNVGSALNLSMVQLQRYMEAANLVFDSAIAKALTAPQPKIISANYRDSREGEKFIGNRWKLLDDGAIVRFSGGGYPTGMLRGSSVREPGRYRVRVTGYAYQSKKPIYFSVGGTTFQAGVEKPTYGFFSFPPGEPSTIEFEAQIEHRYMIRIEPYGISDPQRYKRTSIDEYDGPGLAINEVVLEGPLVDEYPSRGHQLIFSGIERKEIEPRNPRDKLRSSYRPQFEYLCENEPVDVTRSLTRVAKAAFRQPESQIDVGPYVKLFLDERQGGADFVDSMRTAVAAIFCSPNFLYLRENEGRLDDFALASRLAFFLTRSPPDKALLDAAAAGELTSESGLTTQTERLLDEERFARFITDFTEAWLNLRDMDFTFPDTQLYPEFDPYLRYSMPLETEAFLREMVDANLPVASIVDSDFAMLNSRLAEHYSLPAVAGAEIRKVRLPKNSIRGGFLTQGAILKVSANGTNTSPVVRGVWVMERILGKTPSPPPPGVPGVEPDIRGAETLREMLVKHRRIESCNSCHQEIDPPGFALEVFNPIGGYRDRYRTLGSHGDKTDMLTSAGRPVRYRLGTQVDCTGKLPDGREFKEFKTFQGLLASDEETLAQTLATKLLTFATGRELGFSDRQELARIVNQSAQKGYGTRDLIHLVISSEIFRNK